MRIYSFEKLEAWTLSRSLRKEIYKLTDNFPSKEQYGLTSQIKRSCSGIGDCLAEGSGRITPKDKAHFITMAYASTLETLNHLLGALDLRYIDESQYSTTRETIEKLTYKISALRKSILAKASVQ